ncbi:MAG: hypothetical protein IPP85_08565 [Propionivibrio sp.]|nr:hypothetical protein [Propionivibrio sp.]
MKQAFLPGCPHGAEKIGNGLSLLKEEGMVTYFLGSDNYFSHAPGDRSGERFALTSLMVNRHVRAVDLERSSLGIPHRTLMNWMAQYREAGPGSFYAESSHQKPRVMTPNVVAECANLLAAGYRPAAIARQVGIGESTLRKAIARKHIVPCATIPTDGTDQITARVGSTKGERSRLDAEAAEGIGTACTRADERMAAALGLAHSAATRFEPATDVSLGGLLAGLPALCANGLLSGIDRHLKLPAGFYSCLHILLILGFMALSRIRRPEGLRHIPPGEFGRVIGLDRVPEVRTLREKITLMATSGDPAAWMRELATSWMESDPTEAGYLYIDGHVRVYHGDQAVLPRRYVSRERLCLRGTTDYWINDALGRPFFVVSKAITSGLGDTLLKDIVPQLLESVPGQPAPEQLAADPRLHRFVLVFDREGATAVLLEALWQQRIGAITYRKNVKDVWPASEFAHTDVALPDGVQLSMKLAMRETRLGETLTVKEVRRLTATGHQTAVISTAHTLDSVMIAGRMFARWCQENFFAYMMQHYDIDGLVQYGAQAIPGTETVINPRWREADKALSRARQNVRKLQARLGACSALDGGADIAQKAECLHDIQVAQTELQEARTKRKAVARKVTLDSLPAEERPTQLLPLNKMLCDTVKMVAYRAETALVALLRRHLNKEDEARALVRALFVASADLAPDALAKTLTVKIHRMASPVHDRAIAALLNDLNDLNFCHPETGDRLCYSLV